VSSNSEFSDFDPVFFGRDAEMAWLDERILRQRRSSPIVVAGAGGVGKTALLRQFLTSRRLRSEPAWLNLEPSMDPMGEVSAFVENLYSARGGDSIVAIDGADRLSDEQMEVVSHRVLNLKRVRALIFLSRRTPIMLMPLADILSLSAMSLADAEALLRRLLSADLSPEMLARAAQVTAGFPRAARLLADFIRDVRRDEVADLLRGEIYDVEKSLVVPSTNIITEITPRIVVANATLMERLKKQPESIFQIPSRQFEEIVAELLDDMGFEVEITKATRDGGKDILAYMSTGIGKFLCLVEAKKYRQDRTVGVELVRTLYGTLCDYQANSAMLVTTSSFSADARAFQRKHEYQLSLQDYGTVVQWIHGYKTR
jgi:restriction system protein